MQPKVLKYLLDIKSTIDQLESVVQLTGNDFNQFKSNFLYIRTTERTFEIIGEALKRLKELDPQIGISDMKSIIGLRNLIAHAYDSIEPELLWAILIKDLPLLKCEVDAILD